MKIFIPLTLLLATALTYAADPNMPHNADAMWLEDCPIQLTTENLDHTIGYKFNVTVWVNLTFICGAWQFKMIYNNAHLTATGAGYTAGSKSDFFNNISAVIPVAPIFDSYNATHDYVLHGESALFQPFRKPGYGSLSWVEFEVVAEPPSGEILTSIISISESYPADTKLLDSGGQKPPFDVYDCQYTFTSDGAPPIHTLTITSTTGGTTNPIPGSHPYVEGIVVTVTSLPDFGYELERWELNGSDAGSAASIDVTMDDDYALHAIFTEAEEPPPIVGTRLYVDPPEIVDPTKVPSTTFTINITVYNVTDLQICRFNLTYDTTFLSWVGIELLRVQGQVPIGKSILDDEVGYIWVKLTYETSFTTAANMPLVAIEFHVDATGGTCYDLQDTELLDSSDQPIPHEATGGCFSQYRTDVSVIGVVPSRSWVYQGWSLDINVTAKNEGDVNATFHLTAYYDSNLIGNVTIEDLLPSDEFLYTFIWNTTEAAACQNYTISAKASIVPYEIDIADNEYIDDTVKVRFLGDVDGNDKVDTADIFLVALGFGTIPGDPAWNPDADMDQSLTIDILDIYLVATNFGASCST